MQRIVHEEWGREAIFALKPRPSVCTCIIHYGPVLVLYMVNCVYV